MNVLSRLLGRRGAEAATGWVEPEVLAAQLRAGAAGLMVDVRGADEFIGPLGHIEGALNLPLADLAAHLPQLVGERRPLVMVCKTDRRSAAAAGQLRASGATDVAVLRGGMERWQALGLP